MHGEVSKYIFMFLQVLIWVQNIGTGSIVLGVDIKSLASLLSHNKLDLMNVESLLSWGEKSVAVNANYLWWQ